MPRRKSKKKLRHGEILRQRAIKVRIFPNEEQRILIGKTIGSCRWLWNNMLSDEIRFYEETDKVFIPQVTAYRKQAPFLKEVDSLALANAKINLEEAFRNYRSKTHKAKFPTYKSKKKSRASYTTNCQYQKERQTIYLVRNGIRLPKLGVVAANIHRFPQDGWKLKSATISQSRSGKYFCSLLYEFIVQEPQKILPTEETAIGLDYSSPLFYVDDHGYSPAAYQHWFRRLEEKLACAQRKLSRMKKGSSNYQKQQHRIALIHEHIANQRKDFAHQESRRIANAWDTVCVEDLNLQNIAQSLHLGKATCDNGFGMFREFLSYKLDDQGKHLITIDKWYPSSKTCYHCGYVNDELTLADREWRCPSCGNLIHRDKNAAKNIKSEGIALFYKNLHPQIA